MKTLYLRFSLLESLDIEYVLFDDKQTQDKQWQVFETILSSTSYDNVVLFLPDVAIAWHTLNIPSTNKKQQQLAIPFALESEIGTQITQVHYLIKPSIEKGVLNVGVISKDQLNSYLSAIEVVGLSPNYVIAESEALQHLPQSSQQQTDSDNQWHCLWAQDYVVMADQNHQASFHHSLYQPELFTPQDTVIHYGTQQPTQLPPEINFKVIDNVLLFLAKNTDLKTCMNWLEVNKKQTTLLTHLKPYYFSLVLIGLLLLGVPGSLWLEQIQHQKQKQSAAQKMTQLYAVAYPKAKNIVDPYAQLISKLKKQTKGGGSQFLPLMSLLESALVQSVEIQSITYAQQNIVLSIASNQTTQIDIVKDNLADNFKVEAKASTQDKAKTIVTLILQKKQ